VNGYRLGDLIDIETLQKLADSNFSATGLPVTIVDAIDLSILVKAGWPEICSKFHRAHPLSRERCHMSDSYVGEHLGDSEVIQYKCRNGLWHVAMPIIVAEQHLATLFLTQFFFTGELPDRDYFTWQALEFGYDLADYLAAVDAMPVFSDEKIDYILAYDKALVRFISDMALQSLRAIETKKHLEESEEQFRTLVNNVNIGVYRTTVGGQFMQVNSAMATMFDYESPEELLDVDASSLYLNPVERDAYLEELSHSGSVKAKELAMRKKDGTVIWCSGAVTAQHDADGRIVWMDGFVEDVTERRNARKELQKAHDELEARVVQRTAALLKTNELLLVEIRERKIVEQKMRELSETDHLTGIYNRRKLFELLEGEVNMANRYDRPLSLLMFDIDRFKEVNDTFGHNIGDVVLKTTVRIIGGVIRRTDIFARYGGEEFILIMPETDLDSAQAVAEKIRGVIEHHLFPGADRITISIGIAAMSAEESDDALIRRADEALYAAKRGGRNRVEIA